jgi:hypothetical protein
MPFPPACMRATAIAAARTHRIGNVYPVSTPCEPGACDSDTVSEPRRVKAVRRMTTARRALRTAAVSIVAVAWAAVALAAGGELDPSFSGDGWVRTLEVRSPPNTYPPRGGEDVALQSDGKILVTGEILDATSHWYFGVFRNTDDGSLDRSFAGGGLAETDLGARPSSPTPSRSSGTAGSSWRERRTARRVQKFGHRP